MTYACLIFRIARSIQQDARAFYGYYAFDYDVDGQTAAMSSVNRISGTVGTHT
jgi:hypothetical protein